MQARGTAANRQTSYRNQKQWRNAPLIGGVLLLTACSMPVAQGLDEQQANQVVVALLRGGVVATKEPDRKGDGQWAVTVSRSDATHAVTLLATEGPPATRSAGLLESMGSSTLIPTPRSEQIRFLAGTAGEIEHSLRDIDGVLSARVHLAASAAEPLGDAADVPRTTASVLIRHREGQTPISIPDVQRLVAGAVSGLSAEQVSVVLKPVPFNTGHQAFARVGPLTVSAGSVTPLRWMLGTAIATNLILGGLLVWFWRRVRQSRT